MQRIKDSSLRRSYHCRLSIADLRSASHCAGSRMSASRVLKGTPTHKDVKNEGRSDYVYENKARATKCHARNAAFYTQMHQLHGHRHQSSERFVRTCTGSAINRGNAALEQLIDLLVKNLLLLCREPAFPVCLRQQPDERG